MLAAGWCGRLLTVALAWWVVVLPVVNGEPLTVTRLLWAVLIGSFLWMGASDAIRVGRARRVFERTTVGSVCRPVAAVGVGTSVDLVPPVPEGTELVAVDTDGQPVGVLDQEALSRVPEPFRRGTLVGAVVQHQPAGWVVTARPEDPVTNLVVTMQTLRTPVLVVRAPDGALLGLVRARDV